MFMQVIAIVFALAVVALAVGSARGRSQVNACCPAPEYDLRMRDV
jgi:hypothetical protein